MTLGLKSRECMELPNEINDDDDDDMTIRYDMTNQRMDNQRIYGGYDLHCEKAPVAGQNRPDMGKAAQIRPVLA